MSSRSFQIRVRASVREVVAIYTLDESSMELVIQLPNNFPLGPVKVESGKKVGVGNSQWRNWNLQLTTFLQVRNHSPNWLVWNRYISWVYRFFPSTKTVRFWRVWRSGSGTWTSGSRVWRSATFASTSSTEPTTSCPSWPAGPARRSSTPRAFTSGSPRQTTRPVPSAGICSNSVDFPTVIGDKNVL